MHIRSVLSALLLAAVLTACAGAPAAPDPEITRALAPTGKLRVGVYLGSPTSMVRDPASGEVKGVSVDLGKELASRLGVPYEQVEFPRVAEVVEGLRTGKADFTVTNASPARAKLVDFTQPVVSLELGFLVPPGGRIASLADVDRPGMRIGVSQGSTSQGTLPGRLKNAQILAAPTVRAAIDMLKTGKLDAFATNKGILYEMSDSVPGSRVLDGRWGVENLAIAVPQGRQQALPYLRKFVEEANARGLVVRAAERAGLRGLAKSE